MYRAKPNEYVFTKEEYDDLVGYAAMLANLDAIGEGPNEATLAELQTAGGEMLDILDA